MYRDSSMIA